MFSIQGEVLIRCWRTAGSGRPQVVSRPVGQSRPAQIRTFQFADSNRRNNDFGSITPCTQLLPRIHKVVIPTSFRPWQGVKGRGFVPWTSLPSAILVLDIGQPLATWNRVFPFNKWFIICIRWGSYMGTCARLLLGCGYVLRFAHRGIGDMIFVLKLNWF